MNSTEVMGYSTRRDEVDNELPAAHPHEAAHQQHPEHAHSREPIWTNRDANEAAVIAPSASSTAENWPLLMLTSEAGTGAGSTGEGSTDAAADADDGEDAEPDGDEEGDDAEGSAVAVVSGVEPAE